MFLFDGIDGMCSVSSRINVHCSLVYCSQDIFGSRDLFGAANQSMWKEKLLQTCIPTNIFHNSQNKEKFIDILNRKSHKSLPGFSPRLGRSSSGVSVCSGCHSIRRGSSGSDRVMGRMFDSHKETKMKGSGSGRWARVEAKPSQSSNNEVLQVCRLAPALSICGWICTPSWCPSCSQLSTFAVSLWVRCQLRSIGYRLKKKITKFYRFILKTNF